VLSYLDLDQFKVINDTCGHFAGDQLLRRLAALLQARVRQRDTLARLGGDEFGVLMEHCGLPQARLVADDLRQTVERFRFQWEGKTFAVGASIGLVAITGDLADLGEAMRAADSACYVAKDQGRNRIHVYDPDDEELARRHGEMQWVSRIGDALENARLCLACQLIAPVRQPSRGGLRYEILLRMEDDEGGLVLPGAFLPAAERYGLASRLDRWVVQHTLEQLARHPAHVERLESCAINLSGQSLGDPDFLTAIAQMLDRSGISPEKICFEITETAAIADVANAVEFMRALEQRGCRFALDDFGSGLSSFGYLKTLPVHFLKIDGTFVRGLAGDSVDAAMVRSINDIGHAMGKQTIAEYVEDGEILAKLASIGVDYAQGYHVARPMPLQRLLDESAPASGFT
jgi:diguanylate cyclase (GGDEF)-like protein